MTPEYWARVKAVLGSALEKHAEERAVFLNQACGGDEGLRRDVERLLAGERDSRLASPLQAAKTLELSSGQMLEHYRIESKLGEGGMGVVYRALDLKLSCTVALKLLPPGNTDSPQARERFLLEARAASTLDHPNIAAIYAIEEGPGGELCIVMA
jgi:serine/threonine-protein kinase